jgi:dipeptidyl aminopeptidase/acylaminoacyl peptidase
MNGEIELTEKYERNGWPSLSRPDVKPPEGWNLSLLAAINRVRNHSLSPDGRKIAFVWDREEFSDIYVMSSAGGWARRLSFDRPAIQFWWDEVPYWSPDSKWLAFVFQGQIYVVPAAGGVPQRITDFTPNAYSPRWMPDSNQIVLVAEREEGDVLLLTDRSGSWPWSLTSGPGDDRDPQPSPDGKWIVYVHRPFNDLNRSEIRVVENTTGNTRSLTGTPKQKDWNPRWSPDGKTIAFLSQRSGFSEVWLVAFESSEIRQLTKTQHDISDISWSNDGRWIAGTINREGTFDLVVINAGSGELTDLKNNSGVYYRPNWSPKGDFLTVEYHDPITPPDLYRIDISESDGKLVAGDSRQLTYSKPPALERLPLEMPEKVYYPSFDGVKIPAILHKPHKPNGAAVVIPHGGPRDQAVFEWEILNQYLVAKGYTLLEVNYRGSTGYGKEFEYLNQNNWGVGDTKDCLYAARYLKHTDWVDDNRIAILGGSYGGYLVMCALTRDPEYQFACGVTYFGDADLITSWAQTDRDTRLYTEMQIGHPSKNWGVFIEGSPIYQMENLQKPVLLLHGLDDKVVPPQASEEIAESMRKLGKTYEYKTYGNESHGFLKRETVLDVYSRIERFLDWYLMP